VTQTQRRRCTLLLLVVPGPQALEKANGVVENITWELFKETLLEQAEQVWHGDAGMGVTVCWEGGGGAGGGVAGAAQGGASPGSCLTRHCWSRQNSCTRGRQGYKYAC
jgi:hypothetical protein